MTTPPPQLSLYELRQIMELTSAQLDSALRDAVNPSQALGRELADLNRLTKGSEVARRALECLQFFDKLAQRLANARAGLDLACNRLADAPRKNSDGWVEFAGQVRELYSTADERVLFDFFFKGLGADNFLQALGQLREYSRAGEPDMF
jgi:hypothetical protein